MLQLIQARYALADILLLERFLAVHYQQELAINFLLFLIIKTFYPLSDSVITEGIRESIFSGIHSK